MQVQSLDQEDPLEEGMTAHSNILAWRIPWTEEPGGLQSLGVAQSRACLKQLSTYLDRISVEKIIGKKGESFNAVDVLIFFSLSHFSLFS